MTLKVGEYYITIIKCDLMTQYDLTISEIAKSANITSLECSSRDIGVKIHSNVLQCLVDESPSSRVRLCNEFSSDDCRTSLFWIASSYEVICERCFCECKSLASVIFDSDTKVLRFDRYAFSSSGLTSIQIPSSVEMICEC
jgi:hypothetical protein